MISKIFMVIEILLKLFGLWKDFGNYVDEQRLKQDQEKEQRRNDAVDSTPDAKTPTDAWKDQEDIVKNEP